MSTNATTAAPTGRKRLAQGKDATPAADAALGHDSQSTSSPEAAKEGSAWPVVKSGDLFSFVTSGSRGWAKYYSQSGPAFLRVGNLDHDSISLDLREIQRVQPPQGSEGMRTQVRANDILISVTADVGMVGLVPDQFEEAYINQHVALARPIPSVHAPYLAWCLASPPSQTQFKELQRGATKVGLGLDDIRAINLRLPPLPEQQQIVAEIEKQFTRLEAGVAALRRVQANLKRYRAAVLKAACEGKLVPTEAELAREEGRPYEAGQQLLRRILSERRKNWTGRGKYKEPGDPETTNLPPLREGWTWASVEQLGEATTGFTPSKGNPVFFGGEIPFFKPTDLDAGYNVREFRDSLTDPGAEHGRLLPERSILVTCIGATIGKTGLARVRCATNQQINALTVPLDLISPEFVFWFFTCPLGQRQIREKASATTLPILNKSKFETLPIPLPPLAEQTRIVAEVERRLSVVEQLDALVSANTQRAKRLRQSILQKAFTGELM